MKSTSENLTAAQLDQKRREIIKRAKQDEYQMHGGDASSAGFDHVKLRQGLKGNTPLQWLYEKVFFDGYNLANACIRFDRDQDCNH